MTDLRIGDFVHHVKEPFIFGIVVDVDNNLEDVTTCVVEWEDAFGNLDVQWTNKLMKVSYV